MDCEGRRREGSFSCLSLSLLREEKGGIDCGSMIQREREGAREVVKAGEKECREENQPTRKGRWEEREKEGGRNEKMQRGKNKEE